MQMELQKEFPRTHGSKSQDVTRRTVSEAGDTQEPQNQGQDMGTADDQPSVKVAQKHDCHVELEYNFEECYKALTDQLDWNNPKGKEYPFDLSKPLPMIMNQGRQVVPVDFFINNDLEYLKGGSSAKKYTTSTTKTKAAKYDILGIEYMVPSLWSPVKKKLSNPERDVIFDLGVALRMFTRRIVILKRVEDLQLGVKSYHKKLNITKPETYRSDISKRTRYTAYINPQGIICVDKFKRNRLMRSDELYKFSDGTLTSIRSALHDIASNQRMDYLPKRRWSNLDR
nr:hypothetical protein [Tanacetum cinerariifolium]